jgi:hypothetical protein
MSFVVVLFMTLMFVIAGHKHGMPLVVSGSLMLGIGMAIAIIFSLTVHSILSLVVIAGIYVAMFCLPDVFTRSPGNV